MFRNEGEYVTMQTNEYLLRDFVKKKMNTYSKEKKEMLLALGVGREEASKEWWRFSMKIAWNMKSIRKIMRQKRPTERDAPVGGPTFR